MTQKNPFTDRLDGDAPAAPCTVVIFGASGDLTSRKLVPALFNLHLDGLLDPASAIVGFARREMSNDAFRGQLREAAAKHSRRPVENDTWDRFASGIEYEVGDFADAAAYRRLAERLERIDRERGLRGHRLFYLATPPSSYVPILAGLGGAGLSHAAAGGFARIVIEKPYGRDLDSARTLNRAVGTVFEESQVYRIDHYLGKETVQNILVFRLGNGIFEPLWNRRYVDHVQITVAESIGVEGRAGYYDQAGVLRDMLQNHLLQLLCLVAMEPPVRFEADAVRDEKVKVLRALRMPAGAAAAHEVVRAQYAAGLVGGAPVPGYREEPGVAPDSGTETFLAIRAEVENWRWAGVPFFLRSGKRLPRRATEIALVYRRPPLLFFRDGDTPAGRRGEGIEPNVLALRIQPDEGISLSFGSKLPGQKMQVEDVRMDFLYATSFGSDPPEAYEHLLLDALEGDSTLFARRDEVEIAWGLADGLRATWGDDSGPPLLSYPAGSWGPAEGTALIGPGRRWRRV